jgi:hypothetical protein
MLEHLDHLADILPPQRYRTSRWTRWWSGAAGTAVANGNNDVGVGAFVRDLAGTVPPMLQMLSDIGGVRVSDRFVKLE